MKTVKERYVVVWFPPEESKRMRGFKDEKSAVAFATGEDIIRWCPILELRVTTLETSTTVLHNWAF